jgi:hypothetical protein
LEKKYGKACDTFLNLLIIPLFMGQMNNMPMLHEWGWINKDNFLWWNFNYPKEERRFIPNIKDFIDLFEYVGTIKGQKLFVTQSDFIPISSLPLRFGKQTVNFMVTARPFTSKEIDQYFKMDLGGTITFSPRIQGKYMDSEWNSLENKLILDELKSNVSIGSKEVTDHFFPHIRGIIREVNPDSIFYHKMYNRIDGTRHKRETMIGDAVKKTNFSFISQMYEGCGFHDVGDAISKSLTYCKDENLVHVVRTRTGTRLRKPEHINQLFSYVSYEEIKYSNRLKYTYYPLLVEGYKEAVPFFICNNSHGENRFFNLGVYYGSLFYPLKNIEFAVKSSEELSKRLGITIVPVVYLNEKGTLKPKTL